MSDARLTNQSDVSRPVVNRRCSHTNCKGKGSYQIAVVCANCDWSGVLKLTKGHGFSQWGEPCPNCECTNLVRQTL